MMIVTLDNLANRYNCLPSEALARADTFDLYVLDVSARYARYRQDIAEGRTSDPSVTKVPSVDEMKRMIDSVRSEK